MYKRVAALQHKLSRMLLAMSDALIPRPWLRELPAQVTLGPYSLSVEFRERAHLYDRRKLACLNLEDGRIELREDLEGLKLAEAFLECLIRLTHFSKGCQQGCVEEAYTHSFATGMVEFALRNRPAWTWFNLLLNEHLARDLHYDKVVYGTLPQPPQMPKRILVAGRPVTPLSATSERARAAWCAGAPTNAS